MEIDNKSVTNFNSQRPYGSPDTRLAGRRNNNVMNGTGSYIVKIQGIRSLYQYGVMPFLSQIRLT
jgi:hypothetical protein